jgi:hypothetical protein
MSRNVAIGLIVSGIVLFAAIFASAVLRLMDLPLLVYMFFASIAALMAQRGRQALRQHDKSSATTVNR